MSGEGLYVGRPWNGLLGVWQWMGGKNGWRTWQWRPAIVPPLRKSWSLSPVAALPAGLCLVSLYLTIRLDLCEVHGEVIAYWSAACTPITVTLLAADEEKLGVALARC